MLHNEYVEQVNRVMNKGFRGGIILDKDDSKKFEPESMEPRVTEMENVLPVEDWETTFEIDRLMNEGLGDSFMMDDDEHRRLVSPERREEDQFIGT